MTWTDDLANWIIAHSDNWPVLIFLMAALMYQIGKEIGKHL